MRTCVIGGMHVVFCPQLVGAHSQHSFHNRIHVDTAECKHLEGVTTYLPGQAYAITLLEASQRFLRMDFKISFQ